MKRKPKLTKREQQTVEAEAARKRLAKVVDRIRSTTSNQMAAAMPTATPFERAVAHLITMYEPSVDDRAIPTEELVDAALAMVEIAQKGRDISVEETVESLVGICADAVRRDAVKTELDDTLVGRLRLLFTRPPTNPTILARSAAFDERMDELANTLEEP